MLVYQRVIPNKHHIIYSNPWWIHGAGILMLTIIGGILMGSMAHHIWQHHGSVMGNMILWVPSGNSTVHYCNMAIQFVELPMNNMVIFHGKQSTTSHPKIWGYPNSSNYILVVTGTWMDYFPFHMAGMSSETHWRSPSFLTRWFGGTTNQYHIRPIISYYHMAWELGN